MRGLILSLVFTFCSPVLAGESTSKARVICNVSNWSKSTHEATSEALSGLNIRIAEIQREEAVTVSAPSVSTLLSGNSASSKKTTACVTITR